VGDGALDALDPRDPAVAVALARLRADCAAAKETLSVDTETVLPVFLPGHHFEVRLTRSQFEDMVRARIESTVGALVRTVRAARVAPAELSAVLLVGGSSRIPLVERMVAEELGRPTVVDINPKYSVALGAAVVAGRAALIAAPGPVASVPPAAPGPVASPPLNGPGHRPVEPPAAPVAPPPVPARSRPARRLLAIGAVLAVVLAAIVALVARHNSVSPPPAARPALSLTTAEVADGDQYFATAEGFVAGEPVTFSWTGPTTGVMGSFPADAAGRYRQGPIIERDPPGDYTIIVIGGMSGRSAKAPLRVLPPA
jgi:hypothetical protein